MYKRQDSDGSIPTAGICVSALQKTGIQELKECIAHLGQEDSGKKALVRDLIRPLDRVILVIPIDKAAPKGRPVSYTHLGLHFRCLRADPAQHPAAHQGRQR